MRLDDDMRRVVREQSLGFVATVCPTAPRTFRRRERPSCGTTSTAFLHLHSPGTVANLALNPSIEINVVDPIVRKGYRFKGHAEVLTSGGLHAEVLDYFRRERGTDVDRVRAVVLVRVDIAAPLVSPAYDSGMTEAEVVRRWRDHHLGLAASRLPERCRHGHCARKGH